MMPEINRAVADGVRLRVLYFLGPEFESFSVGAMFDDALIGVGHTRAWEKAAVVTDKEWVHKSFGLFAAISPIEMRAFHNAELEEAVRWAGEEKS
jgi:hypothetical protein